MNHMYLPVKVLDRQWADELMQGHVYMRALEDFGGWRIMEGGAMGGEDLNNDFRGDVAEGFARNLAPGEPDPIFDNFPQDFKDAMIQRGFIDDAERETRIFSMTRLMYDAETKSYKKLPAELSQFGDTAVIITDPAAFYQRVVAFYHRLYETSFVVEVGEIAYKDIFRDYGDWGLYTKVKNTVGSRRCGSPRGYGRIYRISGRKNRSRLRQTSVIWVTSQSRCRCRSFWMAGGVRNCWRRI